MTEREWVVEEESFLNQTEYSICRDADVAGMPRMCLGVFRGMTELQGFGDMLQKALDDGRAADEARAEYEQIIRAIRRAGKERISA